MQNPMLTALTKFATQKPGLERVNYDTAANYRADARAIRADLARYMRALVAAQEAGTTDDDLSATLDKGGRLRIAKVANRGPTSAPDVPLSRHSAEYTAGQYWPTEYRKAAAAALERANAHALARTAPTYDTPARTVAEMKRRNKRAGLHWFDASFGGRYILAFPGCLIEEQQDRDLPFSIHFQTSRGAMSLAFYRERFSTLADARERAEEIRATGQEPKE